MREIGPGDASLASALDPPLHGNQCRNHIDALNGRRSHPAVTGLFTKHCIENVEAVAIVTLRVNRPLHLENKAGIVDFYPDLFLKQRFSKTGMLSFFYIDHGST